MNEMARLVILLCGLLFLYAVIHLLIRRRISERVSLLWLFGAVVVLILSAFPGILERAAHLVGVYYPPALLFLVSILVLLYISLHQSIQITILETKLRELAQITAIQHGKQPAEIREGLAEAAAAVERAESK